MSLGRSMWVTCDGTPPEWWCDEEVVLTGVEATPAQVRAEAARQGWVKVKSGRDYLDLCPKHRKF